MASHSNQILKTRTHLNQDNKSIQQQQHQRKQETKSFL